MNRRLPIQCFVPRSCKRSDFKDVVTELIDNTKIKVEDGYINMRLIHREKEVIRFGRKFNVVLLAFFGHVHIYITEA